jgi:hypothetical protein
LILYHKYRWINRWELIIFTFYFVLSSTFVSLNQQLHVANIFAIGKILVNKAILLFIGSSTNLLQFSSFYFCSHSWASIFSLLLKCILYYTGLPVQLVVHRAEEWLCWYLNMNMSLTCSDELSGFSSPTGYDWHPWKE